MARNKNRKKKQLNVRLLPVPLTIGVMALSSYALGWIWLECRCEALGRDIKHLETQQAAIERKCQIEQFQWSRLKSPQNLENELERRGIEMGWPRKDQVIRISKQALVAEMNGMQSDGVAKYAKATTRE
jgi:hypothetical protein